MVIELKDKGNENGGKERGLLLEQRGTTGVILCPDGSFRRVKIMKPCSVGTEGEFTTLGETSALRHQRADRWRWLRYSLAACLFLVLVATWLKYDSKARPSSINPSARVIAYATVDINPSLEFGIDDAGRVQSARGLDQEGTLLLQDIEYHGQDLLAVTARVLEQAAAKGYLVHNKQNVVLVTISPCSEDPNVLKSLDPKVVELKETVRAATRRLGLPTEVGVVYLGNKAGPKLRDKANQLQSSPGKMAVMLQLEAEGKSLPGKEMVKKPIQAIAKEAGAQIGNVMKTIEEKNEKDWEQLLGQLLPGEQAAEGPKSNKGETPSPGPTQHPDTVLPDRELGHIGKKDQGNHTPTDEGKGNRAERGNPKTPIPEK